jgi:uncharacterized phiE125 gp8 family phage protein
VPRPPLQSITSIKYYDTAEVEATFSSADYFVDTVSTPGRIVLKWQSLADPTLRAVVAVRCGGWTTAASVPARLRQAMLLLIGHWYENVSSSCRNDQQASRVSGGTLLQIDGRFGFELEIKEEVGGWRLEEDDQE